MKMGMRGNELSSKVFLFTLAAGLLGFAPQPPVEASSYRSLCDSAPAACSYTGPSAPVLKADVCWNRVTATLKGTAPCMTGSWAYFVEYGEVIEPLTGLVQAYIPLDDACEHGYCVGYAPAEPTWSDALCCTSETADSCVPKPPTVSCNGKVVFCDETSDNGDGTVTCHLVEE